MTEHFAELGSRVVTSSGDVGLIEEIDGDMVRVRLMTPNDEPSCLSSWCFPADLSDGRNVKPQPRSKAWKKEAALFCAAIANALRN